LAHHKVPHRTRIGRTELERAHRTVGRLKENLPHRVAFCQRSVVFQNGSLDCRIGAARIGRQALQKRLKGTFLADK
jgi:hypothetical protein